MPRFSGQFCKKWMREGGFFFSEVFFLFSKNFIKSTTAETEYLSYFSWKVHPSGADCPFFMELYNSVNVHDVEKSKIMLHGIKTLLE
jgi:hypothetical protein